MLRLCCCSWRINCSQLSGNFCAYCTFGWCWHDISVWDHLHMVADDHLLQAAIYQRLFSMLMSLQICSSMFDYWECYSMYILIYRENKSTAIFGLSEEVIYALHISSTSLEWASVGWLCIYFVTFAAEFKHVRIGMPVIHTEPRTIGFSQMELDSISTEGSNKF
uniref:Uncharacterized protein n=1 Tax=Biomphalaria glabrata TaxID=6526 RepID=A0A2C9KZD7_BIOGL